MDDRLPRWMNWTLPLLSGGLLVFAFPGWNSQLAVWLWLFPLLAVIWPLKSSKVQVSGFKLGYLAGLAFFLPNLWWIRHSSRVMLGGARDEAWAGWGPELLGFGAVIGLAGYCAVYFGLWAWFVARFARPHHTTLTRDAWWPSTQHSLVCSFLAAGAWVACEWLRSTTVFTGFGWNGLGVAFHRNVVLMQGADTVGVMGLSFLPVFVACTAWNVLTRFHAAYHGHGTCKTRVDFTVAMVLVLMVGGYGMLKVAEKHSSADKVRIAMVQPNVSQVDAMTGSQAERIYERLREFTRVFAKDRDLVIWPESALPVNLNDKYHQLPPNWHQGYFESFMEPGNAKLLTGTEIHLSDSEAYVSAILFDHEFTKRQEHHKVHLVPFGEYLPLREVWPFSMLRPIFPADFTFGTKTEPMRLNDKVSLIPLICFEDTVGRVARRFVREEPQIIAAISNDGWFIDSIETEMHLANAKFRAVELRRPMVRCSNIGVTCFIDDYGRETSRLHDPDTKDTFIEGVLPGEVTTHFSHLTFYARFGDLFAISLLGLCLLIIILRWKGTHACPA
ncbi:MAG: apolipoprotein N-acyltransferase [Verrucomicrobiaceae bacterium]|nr:apolipoprotein N-acyltransferase [Verrucomicrobiaceae bacterium]